MLKPVVLLGVFGAGVAVGAIGMRNYYGKAPAAADTRPTETVVVSTAPPPSSRVEIPGSQNVPRSGAAATAGNSLQVERPSPAIEVASDPGSIAQPIDAGPAFNKMMAEGSDSGHQDHIRDAHRALERETRDDGWAYTMESELQGVMVNEIATSAFKLEHMECRATLCEVRLSGSTPVQVAALKQWNESFIGQNAPLGQRLQLRYSSSIGQDERTDVLMIFMKPPPPGSTPEPAPQPPAQQPVKKIQKVARQD